MKNNYKKNILSKALILGVITTPILVGTALIINSNITSNKSTLLTKSKTRSEIPLVPENGIIDRIFARKLISYKRKITGWDGSLLESDFAGATSVATNAFLNNPNITSISLPTSVTSIGTNAFAGAIDLTNINALGATTIDNNAFYNIENIVKKGIRLTYSTNIKIGNIINWSSHTVDKYLIYKSPTKPTLPANGIIDKTFIDKIITYENSLLVTGNSWDGILDETYFNNATSVAANVFQDNTQITSITLPNTVTSIGADAFSGASSLTSVTALGVINIGTNAFSGTTSITNGGIKLTYSENIKPNKAITWGTINEKLLIANLPLQPSAPIIITSEFVNKLIDYKINTYPLGVWNGVLVATDFTGSTSIDVGAFQDNTQITSITLPNTVTLIGDNAFSGAINLNTMSALGATSISANVFAGTTSMINQGIELTYSQNIKIGNVGLWGTTIEKVSIVGDPNVPTIIDGIITSEFVIKLINYKKYLLETGASWDGILLESDFVGATTIAANAFENNNEITSITLPNTVTLIGANAFNGNSNLTTISALGVTDIGNGAFAGTTSITPGGIKLTYSQNIKPSKSIFWGTNTDKISIINTPKPIEPLSGIITPEFVNELIAYKNSISTTRGFWDGVLVESDFVGATSVADGAFKDKKTITSIILPISVKTIGADAFSGASSLTSISALGVTNIGTNAFSGMTKISNDGIKLTYSENITIDKFKDWGLTIDGILDIKNLGFFDDVNNIYMIVGVSVGVLLLIAGGLTGFLLYRKNLNGSDSSEDKKEKIVKKEKDKKDKSEDKESKKEKDKKDKSKKEKDSKKDKSKDSKDDLKNKIIDIEDEDSKEIDDLSKIITDEVLDSISIQELKDEIDD